MGKEHMEEVGLWIDGGRYKSFGKIHEIVENWTLGSFPCIDN
jgi:hypothetical protein